MPIDFWQGRWQGKQPAGLSHTRSRTVIRHTGAICRRKRPSFKTGRMVHAESMLEDDAILHFELSPMIVNYREQVEPVYYPDGNRLRKYTPDFELVLQSGEIVIVEVKPKHNCEKEDTRYKLNRISEYFARANKAYVIVTDGDVRQQPRRMNLEWLYGQIPRKAPSIEAMKVNLERYRQKFPMNFGQAVAQLQAHCVHPVSLLMAGHLRCDLEQPLSDSSLIFIKEEADDDWFYLKKAHSF